ncbi:hypothetical protein IWZ03DRAFT_130377 [Phyllosticta citriasiana]|uniref:Uncharacterized protein n=1 Tax=Phyllosticta citriasiana TaxID=595635 RepID=A0ABR1KSW1_9PEZI
MSAYPPTRRPEFKQTAEFRVFLLCMHSSVYLSICLPTCQSTCLPSSSKREHVRRHICGAEQQLLIIFHNPQDAAANLNGEHGGGWGSFSHRRTCIDTGCLLIPSQNGPAKSSKTRIELGTFHGRRTTLHHIHHRGPNLFPLSQVGRENVRAIIYVFICSMLLHGNMYVLARSSASQPASHRLSVCFHLHLHPNFVPTQPITHLLRKRSVGKTEKAMAGQVTRW